MHKKETVRCFEGFVGIRVEMCPIVLRKRKSSWISEKAALMDLVQVLGRIEREACGKDVTRECTQLVSCV